MVAGPGGGAWTMTGGSGGGGAAIAQRRRRAQWWRSSWDGWIWRGRGDDEEECYQILALTVCKPVMQVDQPANPFIGKISD